VLDLHIFLEDYNWRSVGWQSAWCAHFNTDTLFQSSALCSLPFPVRPGHVFSNA